jgi:hypothetical protein
MSFFKKYRSFLLTLSLILLTLAAGCSEKTSDDLTLAPLSGMPEEVQTAAASVREAYQFAAANPDAVKNVPCYCGCGAMGHTSNYSCYVQEVKADGKIVFDTHALGCSICVDITRDVMKMTKEGQSNEDVRRMIDQTYAQYGPSNFPVTP